MAVLPVRPRRASARWQATNRAGEGTARTVLDWQFEPARRPASVIIHERHTSTGASDSGTAGKRVACLTVPF